MQTDETRIVHDALELFCCLDELGRSILVADLFGDDMSPTEGIPITLLAAPLFGRLRQEQVARMIEERTFVEMPLERTRQETHIVLLYLRFVPLAHEPILLVDDTVIGQDLDGLAPCGMDRLVFRSRYRI